MLSMFSAAVAALSLKKDASSLSRCHCLDSMTTGSERSRSGCCYFKNNTGSGSMMILLFKMQLEQGPNAHRALSSANVGNSL